MKKFVKYLAVAVASVALLSGAAFAGSVTFQAEAPERFALTEVAPAEHISHSATSSHAALSPNHNRVTTHGGTVVESENILLYSIHGPVARRGGGAVYSIHNLGGEFNSLVGHHMSGRWTINAAITGSAGGELRFYGDDVYIRTVKSRGTEAHPTLFYVNVAGVHELRIEFRPLPGNSNGRVALDMYLQ